MQLTKYLGMNSMTDRSYSIMNHTLFESLADRWQLIPVTPLVSSTEWHPSAC